MKQGVLFWTRREQVQCVVSTASVVIAAYGLVAYCFEFDWTAIVVRHVVPLLVMNYWLVMVTYLQHHEADTNVGYRGHLMNTYEQIVSFRRKELEISRKIPFSKWLVNRNSVDVQQPFVPREFLEAKN